MGVAAWSLELWRCSGRVERSGRDAGSAHCSWKRASLVMCRVRECGARVQSAVLSSSACAHALCARMSLLPLPRYCATATASRSFWRSRQPQTTRRQPQRPRRQQPPPRLLWRLQQQQQPRCRSSPPDRSRRLLRQHIRTVRCADRSSRRVCDASHSPPASSAAQLRRPGGGRNHLRRGSGPGLRQGRGCPPAR